jgi:hypothetical protein
LFRRPELTLSCSAEGKERRKEGRKLLKKFSVLCGIWRSITIYTRAHNWSFSWAKNKIQSISSHLMPLRSMWICSYLPINLTVLSEPTLYTVFRNVILLQWWVVSVTFSSKARWSPVPSDIPECLLSIFATILHIWREFPPSVTWRCVTPRRQVPYFGLTFSSEIFGINEY